MEKRVFLGPALLVAIGGAAIGLGLFSGDPRPSTSGFEPRKSGLNVAASPAEDAESFYQLAEETCRKFSVAALRVEPPASASDVERFVEEAIAVEDAMLSRVRSLLPVRGFDTSAVERMIMRWEEAQDALSAVGALRANGSSSMEEIIKTEEAYMVAGEAADEASEDAGLSECRANPESLK